MFHVNQLIKIANSTRRNTWPPLPHGKPALINATSSHAQAGAYWTIATRLHFNDRWLSPLKRARCLNRTALQPSVLVVVTKSTAARIGEAGLWESVPSQGR